MSNREKFITDFFNTMNKETESPANSREYAMRSLYLLLNKRRNALPWIDVDDISSFQRAFRQQDITSCADTDLAIWYLLSIGDTLNIVLFCAKKALGLIDDGVERWML